MVWHLYLILQCRLLMFILNTGNWFASLGSFYGPDYSIVWVLLGMRCYIEHLHQEQGFGCSVTLAKRQEILNHLT